VDDAVVRTTALTKRYGDVVAVNGLDLDVGGAEIFALLGPSGCGKTTALRLVAGLERPDAGTISVGGSTVAGDGTWIPPERRRVGMVFQEWALFPHLDVRANVAFGVDERLAARRVDELMDLVRIGDLGARMPHELSGGQQQRVALARALAPAPAVLLLDEPFSNLDAQLRAHVREEVETVLRETGTPAVFVTHDQEEALSLADRVAVMVAGTIRQVGTPFDVYERPVDAAVARLVGDANVVPGDARAGSVHTPLGRIPSPGTTDGPCDVVLRPERLRVRAEAGGTSRVVHVAFYGDHQSVRCTLPDGTDVEVRLVGPRPELAPGAEVVVELDGPPVVVTSRARASADAVLS
jgi:iron(III) transport system ATP-binding protein